MSKCLISLESRYAERCLGTYRRVTIDDHRDLLREVNGPFDCTREFHTVWDEWAVDGEGYDLINWEGRSGSLLSYRAEVIIVTCPLPYGFSTAELRMQSRRRCTFVRYHSTWLTRLCALVGLPWPLRHGRSPARLTRA